MTVDTSTLLMRSLTARSMRSRPTRYWFSSSSPTERTRRLARLSMSSISPLPSLRFTSSWTTARMSSLRSVVTVSSASRPRRMLSLTRPTARKVVALGVEEQAVEQGVGGLARRRLAGAHDAVDVGQRAVAVLALVGLERVADPRAGVDVIDVEQLELVDPGLVELGEVLGRDLVAGLDVDLAGLLVDQVVGRIAAEDFLGRDDDVLEPVLGGLVGAARRDLLVGLEDDLAGVGVDHVVVRLLAAPGLGGVGDLPAVLAAARR